MRNLLLALLICCAGPVLPSQVAWQQVAPGLPFHGINAAVYDPVARRAVVFAMTSNETFVLHSDTGAWIRVQDALGSPGWRYRTAMAHDAGRNRTVLFGGESAVGTTLADTWQFDGTSWQFLDLSPAPPARHVAGFCYDSVAGVVRLAGGDGSPVGGTPQPLSDCWTFDGSGWSQAVVGPDGPIGPTVMAFDAGRGRCVALADNGTFEWVGSGFVAVPTAVQPPPRTSAAMVYDAFRERIVLYGGNSTPTDVLGDVWEFDGSTWIERSPLGVSVRARGQHGMVFDEVIDAVRAFGGIHVRVLGPGTTVFSLNDSNRYGAVAPAEARHLAPGCVPGGLHTMTADGLPWLGDTLSLSTTAVVPGSPTIFVLGLSDREGAGEQLPFPLWPFGLPLCFLLVSPDSPHWVNPTGDLATLDLVVPNLPRLLGMRVFAQAFVPHVNGLDLAAASDAMVLRVGGR